MRRDVAALSGIGLLYLVVGNILKRNIDYEFNFSVGYAIFLVCAGFESAREAKSIEKYNFKAIRKCILEFSYRIIPLYQLAILFTILSSFVVFNGFTVKLITHKAPFHIFGISNIWSLIAGDGPRAEIIPKADVFHGMWLIEAQFQGFLLIFLCYFIINTCASGMRKFSELVIAAVFSVISSVILYVLYGDKSYILIARCCQFGLGILAAMANKSPSSDEKTGREDSETKSVPVWILPLQCASLTVCLFFFAPIVTFPPVAEIIATLSTVSIIGSGCRKPLFLLDNVIGAFIGKIAFPAYLLHIPLLCFVNNFVEKGSILSANVPGFILPFVFALSLLFYYLYQQPLKSISKEKNHWIFVLIVGLIALNVVVVSMDKAVLKFTNGARDRAIVENEKFVVRNYTVGDCEPIQIEGVDIQMPYGYCKFEEGVRDGKILIIGDLFALGDAEMIYKEFAFKHGELRMFAMNGFLPLLQSNKSKELNSVLADYRPHIVIIDQDFARQRIPSPANGTKMPLKGDPTVAAYRQAVSHLFTSGVSHIVVVGPRSANQIGFLDKLQTTLATDDKPIETYHWKAAALAQQNKFANLRLRALSRENVTIVDPLKALSGRGQIKTFDPITLESFFDNNLILTERGQKAAKTYFTEIVDTVLAKVEEIGEDEEEEVEKTVKEPVEEKKNGTANNTNLV